ncbi:MAG: GMC family oxidoreductase [Gemmatimonadetes bacterium]|nr:GMC family oxidoreductase [Gemmatimonadota bacterium]MCC6771675.1 GMC family oxidoreductase [Gemmatimonadaceae bacterium]
MKTIETDILIVGSGITAALMAARLAETTTRSITVVEAGRASTPFAERGKARDRYLAYGENPWARDHLDDQNALGTTWGYSPNMHVGGLAMHWGGVSPRYSPEDFTTRSLYGIGDDWPYTYDDLDPFYQEAEERMGVAGEQGPPALDPRGKPYPLPPLPINYNLAQLQQWATSAGIASWSTPSAKNSIARDGRAQCQRCDTCYPVCPTGAKYSPDFTWDALVAAKKITLIPETLVRRLVADPATGRIVRATGNRTDATGEEVTIEAKTFVLAGGFVWSPHLLLLSRDSAYPDGLANRSGLVGKYLAGHRNVGAQITLPMELYPGINTQHSLVSKQFQRASYRGRYLRHDLRIWESSAGRGPRLRGDDGAPLFGDALLADWQQRAKGATARVRAYYDVLPDKESKLVLDSARKNRFGDPMPHVAFRDAPESAALVEWQEERLRELFTRMAKAGGGDVRFQNSANDLGQEHPTGGCRMGSDPTTSVVDGWGRAHDHENLWVAGAPAQVSASCCNGTLTFVAVGLRTAAGVAKASA